MKQSDISNAAVSKKVKNSTSNAYAATFKRTEKKYCLSTKQYQALMPYIERYMQPDAYPQTVVSSLYFDTPESRLISRSLEKPLYKEKLRVRSYGIEQENGNVAPVSDKVFVELKKKYKGVVYKRRLALSTDAARAFLSGIDIQTACTLFPLKKTGVIEAEVSSAPAHGAPQPATQTRPMHALLTFQERQVAHEISAFLMRYENLQPAMITRCTRNAYKQEGSQLRITFDAQLYAGHPAGDPFAFQIGAPKMNLLQPGQVLMEIKQAGGLPLWLVHALSVNHIYPRSFSKYGTAYEKELKNA